MDQDVLQELRCRFEVGWMEGCDTREVEAREMVKRTGK
jgi:hypothetical protein